MNSPMFRNASDPGRHGMQGVSTPRTFRSSPSKMTNFSTSVRGSRSLRSASDTATTCTMPRPVMENVSSVVNSGVTGMWTIRPVTRLSLRRAPSSAAAPRCNPRPAAAGSRRRGTPSIRRCGGCRRRCSGICGCRRPGCPPHQPATVCRTLGMRWVGSPPSRSVCGVGAGSSRRRASGQIESASFCRARRLPTVRRPAVPVRAAVLGGVNVRVVAVGHTVLVVVGVDPHCRDEPHAGINPAGGALLDTFGTLHPAILAGQRLGPAVGVAWLSSQSPLTLSIWRSV